MGFYVSIQNLFDAEAPIFCPNIGAPGFACPVIVGDDVIGRRFNGGVRMRFCGRRGIALPSVFDTGAQRAASMDAPSIGGR